MGNDPHTGLLADLAEVRYPEPAGCGWGQRSVLPILPRHVRILVEIVSGALAVLAVTLAGEPAGAARGPSALNETVFDLIDEIGLAEPIKLAKLNALTGGDFSIVREFPEIQRVDYEARDISLTDAGIELLDFRSLPTTSLIVLHLTGCVAKAKVASRFRLGPPVPNATDARDTGLYFEAPWPHGRLGFEFLYARPECLSTVVLDSNPR